VICALVNPKDITNHSYRSTYRVFGLRNQTIQIKVQIKVVHHGFIPQIWWDDFIPRISTN
jgi:hypothetical protein